MPPKGAAAEATGSAAFANRLYLTRQALTFQLLAGNSSASAV